MKPPTRTESVETNRSKLLDELLAGVAPGCPHTKSNPEECPLYNVRKMATAEIVAWLDGLQPPEKEYLILYHQCCLMMRWEGEAARGSGRAHVTADLA